MLWRNKDFLIKKYVEDDMTCKEIAQEIGCDWSTILKWVTIFDIPKRTIGTRKGVYYAHNRNGHYKTCKNCGSIFWVYPSMFAHGKSLMYFVSIMDVRI